VVIDTALPAKAHSLTRLAWHGAGTSV
jgi:hypothetical protein